MIFAHLFKNLKSSSMKKFLAIISISLFAFTSSAQYFDNVSNTGMQIYTKSKTPDNYTGSPYVENNFLLGTIRDFKQNKTLPALLRYNAVEDVVEIRLQLEDKSSVLPKYTHIKYDMGDYTYFIDNINTEDGFKESYFANYYDGKNVKFIGVPEPKVTPAQEAKTGYGNDKPASLRVDMIYYISLDGGQYKKAKIKEKDLKDILGESDRIEDYFDNNKIKTIEDIVEMLKYFEKNA